MATCLDPEELCSRGYDPTKALSLYEAFVEDPSEENHLKVWEALIPMIPRLRQNWWGTQMNALDEVYCSAGEQLWDDLVRIRKKGPKFESAKGFCSYILCALRWNLSHAFSDLWGASHHKIPPEHWEYFLLRFQREEGSIFLLEEKMYLQDLAQAIEKWICYKANERWNNDRFTRSILYCLRRFLAGKEPLLGFLESIYDIKDPLLIRDWTLVMMRKYLGNQRERYIKTHKRGLIEFVFAS